MPLPLSSLSRVGRSIADFVSQGLEASRNNIHVMIGSPAEVVPGNGDTDHRVGLFFYRFEPGGFDGDFRPGDPWMLRFHCLVTAFGVLEDQISAGENDLRLLGEVVRIFHQRPILDSVDVDGEKVRTRVVFQPLSVDEINHLWSTQGEVRYRPSVAYEMALVPIVPRTRTVESPLAGSLGFETRGTPAARRSAFTGEAAAPPVPRTVIETAVEDWAPRICLVHGGARAESLAFAVGSPELAALAPAVWIAGATGEAVTLSWEVWDRREGWRPHPATVAATAVAPTLDPETLDPADAVAVELPFDDHAGQAALHASRRFERAADGTEIEVRSNPLLISLFEVTP